MNDEVVITVTVSPLCVKRPVKVVDADGNPSDIGGRKGDRGPDQEPHGIVEPRQQRAGARNEHEDARCS